MCALLLAGGCGYQPVIPERDATPTSAERRASGGVHVVRPGETLYSIAWEAGYDYRDVAAWNGISAPYLIRPGQEIRLEPPSGNRTAAAAATARATNAVHIVAQGETLYSIARRHGLAVRDLASWNELSPPYVLQPGQRLRLGPPPGTQAAARAADNKTTTRRAANAGRPSTVDTARRQAATRLSWVWPVEGALLARFDPGNGSKGIDIGGQRGQPVFAAAAGTVVYRGSGLRGYGQLIIIKHNADFLSAYAHNDKIYVQEGDVVKQGQKIAEMGNTGTDRVKLHFEIRDRGVPVDPLDYLPKR